MPPPIVSGSSPSARALWKGRFRRSRQPLSVSVESAVTTSDEDAAAELSYEEDAESEDGFTDEPVDDSEDDDNED